MRVYVSLSEKSINNAIKKLEDYKNSLNARLKNLVQRLQYEGEIAARLHSGEYNGMIEFSKPIQTDETGVTGVLIATDGVKLIKEWKYQGGLKQAEVSPLLMAEFGSGWLANVLDPVEGVGQGTFPNQQHAFDASGWWWQTPDGEWHHSEGEAPTYPIHSALFTMKEQIESIAREVFNGDAMVS